MANSPACPSTADVPVPALVRHARTPVFTLPASRCRSHACTCLFARLTPPVHAPSCSPSLLSFTRHLFTHARWRCLVLGALALVPGLSGICLGALAASPTLLVHTRARSHPVPPSRAHRDDWCTFFDDGDGVSISSASKSGPRVHTLSTHQCLHSLASHRAQFSAYWTALLPHLTSDASPSPRAYPFAHNRSLKAMPPLGLQHANVGWSTGIVGLYRSRLCLHPSQFPCPLHPHTPVERLFIALHIIRDPTAPPKLTKAEKKEEAERKQEEENECWNPAIKQVRDRLETFSNICGARIRSSSFVHKSRLQRANEQEDSDIGVFPSLMAMVLTLVVSSVGAAWAPQPGKLKDLAGTDPSKSPSPTKLFVNR
ncbi:hypothetical protein FRC08_006512 [Ceratobasidium sp. 394]|nr:hypothetical protein FRC08_006512 [Ceratobasidium sp. 394]